MMSARLHAAMLAVAAVSSGDGLTKSYEDADFKPVGRGRICGQDDGKGTHRVQQRNAACACDSGRKYKKCCGKPRS